MVEYHWPMYAQPDATVGADGVLGAGVVGPVGVAATVWVAVALGVICAAAGLNPPWLLVLTATATTTATNATNPIMMDAPLRGRLRFFVGGWAGGIP